MRTVLTLSVDSYDSKGNLTGSTLAARASSTPVDAHDLFDVVTAALPPEWSQMTYSELVDHFSSTRGDDDAPWEQMTIF